MTSYNFELIFSMLQVVIYCSTLSVKLHFFVLPFKWAYLVKFISALWGKHNGKPSETNVNDKSPKLTCYKLLWLSRENGKKTNFIICENRSVPFPERSNFNLTGPKNPEPTFYILVVKVEICYFLPRDGSRIFHEVPTQKGGRGQRQRIILPNLHENQENWTERGTSKIFLDRSATAMCVQFKEN